MAVEEVHTFDAIVEMGTSVSTAGQLFGCAVSVECLERGQLMLFAHVLARGSGARRGP